MNNMNRTSTMPEISPEITDERVIEALFAVVSEAMVITYVELTHVELLLEHGIHEIFGGERG